MANELHEHQIQFHPNFLPHSDEQTNPIWPITEYIIFHTKPLVGIKQMKYLYEPQEQGFNHECFSY